MQFDVSQHFGRSSAIDALERPRLFQLLDEQRPGAITWLVAAGGYGKTTLAMSYARSRDLPMIWLPIPESGFSVGEFLHALRQAAIAALGPSAQGLPVLSPEYASAPDIFVQRFAEHLIDCQPGAAVLFLDDLHNLTDSDPLQELIAMLCAALRERIRVIVGSRHEPSAAWVGLRGQGRVSLIDERILAFQKAEMAELLSGQGLTADVLEELLPELEAVTGGWPVGLMLLLEHWWRTGELPAQAQRKQSLSDWFMQEIYEPLPAEEKVLLRSCALPAQVPARVVAAATGVEDAKERLERLAHRHAFMFIDTDSQGVQHFRFHDLFRDFLRGRGRMEESVAAVRAHSRHWGRVLWQEGWWSIGAPLLIAADDQEGLVEGIKQAAGVLLQTGCGDKLHEWLQAVPEGVRRAEPELMLWEGMCLILQSTAQARALLGRAWDRLSQRRDYLHMAIAWSGIIDSIWLEWAHVSEYERWITEFLRFENEFREHLPPPLWYAVLRGMLTAVGHGRPMDPALERWERESITALSAADMEDNERVMLASLLMYLNTWQFGRRSGAQRVMTLMQGQQEAIESASPLVRCLWKTFTALWALLFEADHETCLREAAAGRELIRRYGISTWDSAVPALQCALAFRDQEALDDWMAWFMRTEHKDNRPFYDTFQAHFLSGQAWLQGDLQVALDHAGEAVAVGDRHGSVAITSAVHAVYAGLLAEAGQFAQALIEAGRTRRLLQGFSSDFLNVLAYLNLAKIPLRRGQPQRALPYIRRAFEAGERQRLFLPLWIDDEALAIMCALALTHGVAPDYARWLIEVRDLLPPEEPALRRQWPWRCQLNVLGDFVVEVYGRAADQPSSVRPRNRELLSSLIFAGSKGVAQEVLASRFWPDSEPEQALNSLYVALHRLRRGVLGDTEALVSEGGRVRLNPERVRVDVWEFQQLAATYRQADAQTLVAAVELYGGQVQLQGIDEIDSETWHVELASAYEAVAVRLGGLLEPGDPSAALKVYRRALLQVPLSESLWSGVLRCKAALEDQLGLRRSFKLLVRRYQHETDMAPPVSLEKLYQALIEGQSSLQQPG